MAGETDDFFESLGTKLPQRGKKVERVGDAYGIVGGRNSFTSNGYVARVIQSVCLNCGTPSQRLVGIFHEEVRERNAERRLTLLSGRFQLPANGSYYLDLEETREPYCVECLPNLGITLWRP